VNKPAILYQLVTADFKERTRSYAYLLTLLGAVFFGYLVMTGQYSVQFSDYAFVYNSAWVGTLTAVSGSLIFLLAGFYVVRTSISRDRRTRVGEIIAATTLNGRDYIAAKFISNLCVLLSMMAVLALVAFVNLLFRAAPGGIDVLDFAVPFVTLGVPAMAVAAALAVLFDTVRWLRGSIGNIIYLFTAETLIVAGMLATSALDVAGLNLFIANAEAAIRQSYPGAHIAMQMGFLAIAGDVGAQGTIPVLWHGIQWSAGVLLQRLAWVGLAVGIAAFSIPFFDRFDPACDKTKAKRKVKQQKVRATRKPHRSDLTIPTYGNIPVAKPVFSLPGMYVAELRLMLKGLHWAWYLIAAGLLVAQLAAPYQIVRSFLIPAAMVWPLLIWSAMGTRETRHNTGQLLFSSPAPVARQLPAVLLGGLTVSLLAVVAMTLRSLVHGHTLYALTILSGALLVPSLALFSGITTGSKKLFEVVYLIVWYVGSVDKLSQLDILGTTDLSVSVGRVAVLSVLALGFITLAAFARVRQLRA